MAPGSSLGRARPKANVLDDNNELWIAKFPSKNDTFNKGAWEFLSYQLAIGAGIEMVPCKIEKIAGNYHTFFTKRFDREEGVRIHFASAMTMTGNNEDTIRDNPASYLDIAEFIQTYGTAIKDNLQQFIPILPMDELKAWNCSSSDPRCTMSPSILVIHPLNRVFIPENATFIPDFRPFVPEMSGPSQGAIHDRYVVETFC